MRQELLLQPLCCGCYSVVTPVGVRNRASCSKPQLLAAAAAGFVFPFLCSFHPVTLKGRDGEGTV